jgi:hypothetical protein
VTRMRSELGLTGNIPKGPKKKGQSETAAEPAVVGKKRGRRKGASGKLRGSNSEQPPAEMSGTTPVLGTSGKRGGNQGKTAFVTEHLQQNPDATDDEINEAWELAGNEGGISGSLIYKIRAKEGLTGKRGSKGRGAATKGRAKSSPRTAGADSTAESAAETPKPLDKRTNRGRVVAELEGDIDRVIFKLMSVGGLEEIEDGLRNVRRRLILSQGQ